MSARSRKVSIILGGLTLPVAFVIALAWHTQIFGLGWQWGIAGTGLVGSMLAMALLPPLRRVLLRLILVLPPFLALSGGGIVLLLGQQGFMLLNERVQQALIAAIVIATGWMVAFAVREVRHELDRQDLVRDVLEALRSEIWDYFQKAALVDLRVACRTTCRAIMRADPTQPYKPFIPKVSEPVVFQSVGEGLQAIPSDLMGRVVSFYSQLSDERAYTEDLQRDSLVELQPQKRRARIYQTHFEIRHTAKIYAARALVEIDAYLGVRTPSKVLNFLETEEGRQ